MMNNLILKGLQHRNHRYICMQLLIFNILLFCYYYLNYFLLSFQSSYAFCTLGLQTCDNACVKPLSIFVHACYQQEVSLWFVRLCLSVYVSFSVCISKLEKDVWNTVPLLPCHHGHPSICYLLPGNVCLPTCTPIQEKKHFTELGSRIIQFSLKCLCKCVQICISKCDYRQSYLCSSKHIGSSCFCALLVFDQQQLQYQFILVCAA